MNTTDPLDSETLGGQFLDGLNLSKVDGEKISVSIGQAKDSVNRAEMYVSTPISINVRDSGPGGMDRGIPNGFYVRAASTANLAAVYANGAAGVGATLTNAGPLVPFGSMDGIPIDAGDVLLIKNQTAALQNGVYIVSDAGAGAPAPRPWILTRVTQFDQPAEFASVNKVRVEQGSANRGFIYFVSSAVVTIGTSPITYSKFSSWYAVYLIGDFTKYEVVSAFVSLNFDQPTLPAGYTSYRRIGWVKTDANGLFIDFSQSGCSREKTFWLDVPIPVLNAGNETDFNTAPVDLSAGMPPIAGTVNFLSSFNSADPAHIAELSPFGSSATSGNVVVSPGAAVILKNQIEAESVLDAGVPKIRYQVTANTSALTLSIAGFKECLS